MKTTDITKVAALIAILASASYVARANDSNQLEYTAILPPTLAGSTASFTVNANAALTYTTKAKTARTASTVGTSSYTASPDIVPIIPKTNYVFPSIGTLQRVTDYAVKSIYVVSIFADMYDTNGAFGMYNVVQEYIGATAMTNKAELDESVVVGINMLLNNVCTNTSTLWRKDKGVTFNIYYYAAAATGNISYHVFSYIGLVQLIKNADGSYSAPSMDNYSSVLSDWIPFYVPGLRWARTEFGTNGISAPFETDDNNFAAGSGPIGSDGFLYMFTAYITNSSSSTGNLWVKTSLFDGTNVFQLFDGDGNILRETPFNLTISYDSVNAYVTVNGGDPGRGYVVQTSGDLTDVKEWTSVGTTQFVSSKPEGQAIPPQYTFPLAPNSHGFFKTMSVNAPPTN